MPSEASRSRLGVRLIFEPNGPMSPYPMSSTRMTMKLGGGCRAAAPAACALLFDISGSATAIAPVPANFMRSRRLITAPLAPGRQGGANRAESRCLLAGGDVDGLTGQQLVGAGGDVLRPRAARQRG